MGISFQRSRLLIIVTTTLFLLTGLAISFFAAGTHQAHASGGGGFNQPGNVLITDQFNNRVIEVDRHKHIVGVLVLVIHHSVIPAPLLGRMGLSG